MESKFVKTYGRITCYVIQYGDGSFAQVPDYRQDDLDEGEVREEQWDTGTFSLAEAQERLEDCELPARIMAVIDPTGGLACESAWKLIHRGWVFTPEEAAARGWSETSGGCSEIEAS